MLFVDPDSSQGAWLNASLRQGLTSVAEITSELETGRLVRVRPGWTLPPLGVDALVLPRTAQAPRVRAVIEALRTHLASTGSTPPGVRAVTPRPARRRT